MLDGQELRRYAAQVNQSTASSSFRGWHTLPLALSYAALGWLGLLLALPPGYASGIFPAAGLAIAAAYLGGLRALPGVALGSLLLNLWPDGGATDPAGQAAAVAVAAASTAQAGLGG